MPPPPPEGEKELFELEDAELDLLDDDECGNRVDEPVMRIRGPVGRFASTGDNDTGPVPWRPGAVSTAAARCISKPIGLSAPSA